MSDLQDRTKDPEFMKSWLAHPANRLSKNEKEALKASNENS